MYLNEIVSQKLPALILLHSFLEFKRDLLSFTKQTLYSSVSQDFFFCQLHGGTSQSATSVKKQVGRYHSHERYIRVADISQGNDVLL